MTAALPSVPVTDPPAKLPDGMELPAFMSRSTRDGPAVFRSAPVPMWCEKAFFDVWNGTKERFLRRGFAIRKEEGKWHLQQWLRNDHGWTLTPTGAEVLAAALALRPSAPVQGILELPDPELILSPLPSGIESKLYDYQIDPARQLLRALRCGWEEWKYPGGFDGSDMGLGKTAQTMAAALATGRKIVVLCPLVGRAGWMEMFTHFGGAPHYIGTYEGLRNGNRPGVVKLRADDTFEWMEPDEIVLILDEAQCARHDTVTQRMCAGAIRQGIPILIASATIALSPLEMRFMGRVCGLHRGADDWDRFLLTHGCHKKKKAWHWDGDRKHLMSINRIVFPWRGARVRKEELGDKCPETEIKVLPIKCARAQEIEAKWKLAMHTVSVLRRQDFKKAQAVHRRIYQPIWQECELILVPYIAALAKEDIRTGRSVAIFVTYDETRKQLCRAMGTDAGFYGGMKQEMREHHMREFQANRIHCLISNIKAGGASVNLHDKLGQRPRTSYIFPTDNPVAFTQATGRVDRIGGTSSLQWIPCLDTPLTRTMVNRMRDKTRNIDTINDGESHRKF